MSIQTNEWIPSAWSECSHPFHYKLPKSKIIALILDPKFKLSGKNKYLESRYLTLEVISALNHKSDHTRNLCMEQPDKTGSLINPMYKKGVRDRVQWCVAYPLTSSSIWRSETSSLNLMRKIRVKQQLKGSLKRKRRRIEEEQRRQEKVLVEEETSDESLFSLSLFPTNRSPYI